MVRAGDTSPAVSVNDATQNGSAVDARDYTATLGTNSFAPGQTAAAIKILLTDYRYAEGNETFTMSLSGASGAARTRSAVSAAFFLSIEFQEKRPVTLSSACTRSRSGKRPRRTYRARCPS